MGENGYTVVELSSCLLLLLLFFMHTPWVHVTQVYQVQRQFQSIFSSSVLGILSFTAFPCPWSLEK